MLGPSNQKKLIINTTDFEMKLCYNVLGKKQNQQKQIVLGFIYF
jgi:hypothetical protein